MPMYTYTDTPMYSYTGMPLHIRSHIYSHTHTYTVISETSFIVLTYWRLK